MHDFLMNLLQDRKGGEIFRLFTPWHFLYIGLAVATIVLVMVLLRRKSPAEKVKTAGFFSDLAFGLYMADFFLMPLAYGEIDIEKLPFHICTAMCLMCFVSRHVKALEKWRAHFALLGFLSNLIYLIYPAGVMWHQVHPLSYRVIQTLLFHAIMTVYGFLAVVYEREQLTFKNTYRDLLVLLGMTLWAILGNLCYNGAYGEKTVVFNWFFVVGDPFGAIDPKIAPFVMPAINVAAFFALEMLIIGLLRVFRKKSD